MSRSGKYFVVKEKALPEVLLKVVEAKKILDRDSSLTVQEVTEKVGISRSSFYKYKDDIFPFTDNRKGKTVTFILQMDDTLGLLSAVLKLIADYGANVLTINQTIPINGIASLTLSIEVTEETRDVSQMIIALEDQVGVHYLKILAGEK